MKKRIKEGWLTDILWAFCIVTSFCSGVGIVVGAESENALLNFVSKIANSASVFNLIDGAAFLGMLFLIRFVRRRTPRIDPTGAVTGLLLGLLYLLSFAFRDAGGLTVLCANGYQCLLSAFLLFGYSSLIYLLFEAAAAVLSGIPVTPERPRSLPVFVLSAVLILVGWLFWILMSYPGSVAGDAIAQLSYYFSGDMSAHHPPLSTWIMGACVELGGLIADRRFGLFLYLLLQALICAGIMGCCVERMHGWGLPDRLCALTVLFLGFTPIIGLFAQWFEKDMLYSAVTLLFAVQTGDLLRRNTISRRTAAALLAVSLLCCLLRHNGIYSVVPLLFALLFVFHEKKEKVLAAVVLAATVLLYIGITGVLFPAMGIRKGNVREALSIPMQQSARYLRDHGDAVTEEEWDVLSSFFTDMEAVPAVYASDGSDPVKDLVTTEFDHPMAYFRTWFTMGCKHPETYIEAFGCLNYGYLAPAGQNTEPELLTRDVVREQLLMLGIDASQDETRSAILENIVRINTMFPLLRYLTMPGCYVWLVLLLCAVLIKEKRKRELIWFLPAVMTILVCLASPLSNAMRYELSLVLSAPLMIGWTISACCPAASGKRPSEGAG
ncbi:MAG: DUF6020 family protein [Lachnospiraceae bacterium]|nr:DUF6020 family protein [Lachnospiraceae bacterium]